MVNLNSTISNIVSSNKKAVAVCLTYKDNRDVIEFKFNDGVVITTEIGRFGYEGLYNFTDPLTWFYDSRNSYIIEKMRLVSEHKSDFSNLSVYHDRSIIFLIEDGNDGACGTHPNMRIWNGPEKKEYILSGDDLEDMFSTYWRIIKENMYKTLPGHMYFVDRRIKPEYEEIF